MEAAKTRKVYFCGSIRGGRDDAELYKRIIEQIKQYGTVLTEHVGKHDIEEDELEAGDDKWIHDRDMKWLLEATEIIAEVTQPSLGVGYEIGRAFEHGKKILCLFRPASGRTLSAMVRGLSDGKQVIVKDYSEPDMPNYYHFHSVIDT